MDKEDTCIVEYFLVIKNEMLQFAKTWLDLEGIMLSEVGQTKANTYMWSLKKRKKKKKNTNEQI